MEGRTRLTPISHLMPSAPFPFGLKKEDHDRILFGDKSTFREIKTEHLNDMFKKEAHDFSDIKRSSFRFESLATEFEHMEDNDSGIGAVIYIIILYEEQVLQIILQLSYIMSGTN